jgi:hypothetical protein
MKVRRIVPVAALLLGICLLGCPPGPDNGKEKKVDWESLRGKLLILQVYGPSDDNATAASHAFVELYNNSNSAIDLSGFTLWFADGRRKNDADFNATIDKDWLSISLNGSIPAGSSFLILGKKSAAAQGAGSNPASALQIEDGYGDMNVSSMTLSNRACKAALVYGNKTVTVQNPFNADGAGTKVEGYIDMVGTQNTPPNETGSNNYDSINGFEAAPARMSASQAVRRKDFTDTNNNFVDFTAARYPDMDANELELRRPHNAKTDKAWDPFQRPPVAGETQTLMIHQIGAATDGNISRSFVELYNNTNAAINLSGYSVQYATGYSTNANWDPDPAASETSDGSWHMIPLSGTIQPRHSYLVLGEAQETASGDSPPALTFTDNYGDVNIDFHLSNRTVKVALISSQTPLTVQNPFNTDGNGAKTADYVDMIGVRNGGTDQILAFETARGPDFSKQVGVRRKAPNDTDNNSNDFETIRFADHAKGANQNAELLERYRPKNHAYGAWNPVTGDKE